VDSKQAVCYWADNKAWLSSLRPLDITSAFNPFTMSVIAIGLGRPVVSPRCHWFASFGEVAVVTRQWVLRP
jgi:hypothetical protein